MMVQNENNIGSSEGCTMARNKVQFHRIRAPLWNRGVVPGGGSYR
jgi:hypothetical protein